MPSSDIANFGAAFVENFMRSRQGKKEQEFQDKQNKLILKLMEGQLQDANTRREAVELIGRRMSGEADPIPQIENAAPPGELGAFEQVGETPSGIFGPGMSLSEMLASSQVDPKLSSAIFSSGQLPQIEQMAGMQARSQVADQLEQSGMAFPEFAQSPEGASGLLRMGLSPAQFGQQGQGGGLPDEIRETLMFMELGGIPIGSEKGQQIIMSKLVNADDTMYRQTQLELQRMQLAEMGRQREEEATSRTRLIARQRVDTRDTIRDAMELARLNDKLEGSFLETGQPFGDVYRGVIAGGAPFVERLGFDATEARQIAADYQTFNKIASRFGLSLMDTLLAGQTITDTKFDFATQSLAGTGISPATNRQIISDTLQMALDGADIEGIEVSNRAEVQALIKQLKSSGVSERGQAAVDGPGVMQRAGEGAGNAMRSVLGALDSLSSKASEMGGALPNPQEAMQAVSEQVQSLRGMIPQEDIDKALAFASDGSEAGLLAARGVLDKAAGMASRAASTASVAATDIYKMTREEISQLNPDDVVKWSKEQLAALEARMNELGIK